MKKLLLLSLLIVSPIFSEEPYFQQNDQKTLYSILGKINNGTLFEMYTPNIYSKWLGGISVDSYFRFTSANVFGVTQVKLIFPMGRTYLLPNIDFILSAGLGGFLLDKRDEFGIGSFMTMSFTMFFPLFSSHFGMGVSLDTRYSYAFHKKSAFTLGLDIEYRVSDIDDGRENSGLHILGIGMSFGFTFSSF